MPRAPEVKDATSLPGLISEKHPSSKPLTIPREKDRGKHLKLNHLEMSPKFNMPIKILNSKHQILNKF